MAGRLRRRALSPFVAGLRRADWDLPDAHGQPIARVRAIRDEIRDRVHGW